MVLTANLPAATTTTLSGQTITVPTTGLNNANPADWQATANSGNGGYVIDTGTTYTVVETTARHSYSSGDWLLCRTIGGTQAASVWEPVATFNPVWGQLIQPITPAGLPGHSTQTITGSAYVTFANDNLSQWTTHPASDTLRILTDGIYSIRAYDGQHGRERESNWLLSPIRWADSRQWIVQS